MHSPYYFRSISIYIYIYFFFDRNFNNRYFITLEITLIHTVDIEDNKYYLNNIMEKVIPKSKVKFLQKFCKNFALDFGITFPIILFK